MTEVGHQQAISMSPDILAIWHRSLEVTQDNQTRRIYTFGTVLEQQDSIGMDYLETQIRTRQG